MWLLRRSQTNRLYFDGAQDQVFLACPSSKPAWNRTTELIQELEGWANRIHQNFAASILSEEPSQLSDREDTDLSYSSHLGPALPALKESYWIVFSSRRATHFRIGLGNYRLVLIGGREWCGGINEPITPAAWGNLENPSTILFPTYLVKQIQN